MKLQFITHGAARSRYDAKIRAIASQYPEAAYGLETVANAIREDIANIKRANTAIAANSYVVRVLDPYTALARIEISNEVPGPPRLIVTLKPQPNA